MAREAWQAFHGVIKSQTRLSDCVYMQKINTMITRVFEISIMKFTGIQQSGEY